LKEVSEGDDDNQYSNRFELRTAVDEDSDENTNDETIKINKKFKHCVFCAPPSGFDDYPSAIRGAIDDLWMGQHTDDGSFIFTSSGGIYGSGGDSIDVASVVTESSPLPTNPIPRIERLINAENEVLKEKGGSVMRLAGLYLLNRGAHNFWLGNTAEETKDEIAGRPDSLINLLHYEDAAGSVVAALKHSINCRQEQDDEEKGGELFLISDGHPLTRQQICESSLKNKRYDDRTIPKFSGSKEKGDLIGKVYDGSYTDKVLNWKPRYESFDTFMAS
jgi:nucleoside-diphosphate-sugar epimerase